MGCWDIYCFLCGNTCHSALYLKEKFLQSVELIENKTKTGPGFKSYFKPIYDKYNKNPELFINKLNNLEENTEWLNKCTFLAADNKIIHNCHEDSCNISFIDKKGNKYTHGTDYEDSYSSMYGIFIHTDCWKYIKNEYNIELTYSHLPIINKNLDKKIFKFINYGIIEKYWDQFFDFISIVSDSNEELCNTPLKSNLVAKNIKKIISKLKIKNVSGRKAPLVSATFYKNGLYKVGVNGNIWFIKNNKWNEIKNTIISNIKNLKKIVFIADVNNKPVFVLKNKLNEYEILTIN